MRERRMNATERTADNTASKAEGTSRLGRLLEPLGVDAGEAEGVAVAAIEYDSRRVAPGTLFVAVRGLTTDGHLYVAEAARRGAVAALVEEATGCGELTEIAVPDTRLALGLVAHEFYGRPTDALATHAITGTNGKTTTSYLFDSVLRASGATTGVVGTLGYRVGDRTTPGDMTSPESLDLARMLASMVEEGVTDVTIEVSSHALALKRTAGARFDTAAFTNMSRDHLDFHGSFEEYFAAKSSLFDGLAADAGKDGATACINEADEYGRLLIDRVRSKGTVNLLTYGTDASDVQARDVTTSREGTRATFSTPAGSFEAHLRLISEFNVLNALAATAMAVSRGIPTEAIAEGLAGVRLVRGRLETVDAGQDFMIVVDYAHTPDALEKAIAALRPLSDGRLITVFGCGGDRDRGKRPEMGEIAAAGSDIVVVTSDNPRTEAPAAIIAEILQGTAVEGGAAVEVIEDRRSAIEHAVREARRGDIVLIAGKGHEDYQIVGTTKRHFDDREAALDAVAGKATGRGHDGEDAAD